MRDESKEAEGGGVEERGGDAFRTDGWGSFPTFSRLGLLHGDGSAGLGALEESHQGKSH